MAMIKSTSWQGIGIDFASGVVIVIVIVIMSWGRLGRWMEGIEILAPCASVGFEIPKRFDCAIIGFQNIESGTEFSMSVVPPRLSKFDKGMMGCAYGIIKY